MSCPRTRACYVADQHGLTEKRRTSIGVYNIRYWLWWNAKETSRAKSSLWFFFAVDRRAPNLHRRIQHQIKVAVKREGDVQSQIFFVVFLCNELARPSDHRPRRAHCLHLWFEVMLSAILRDSRTRKRIGKTCSSAKKRQAKLCSEI